jgi:hypothetical protein
LVITPHCSMRVIECKPQALAALAAKGDDRTTVGLAKRWV